MRRILLLAVALAPLCFAWEALSTDKISDYVCAETVRADITRLESELDRITKGEERRISLPAEIDSLGGMLSELTAKKERLAALAAGFGGGGDATIARERTQTESQIREAEKARATNVEEFKRLEASIPRAFANYARKRNALLRTMGARYFCVLTYSDPDANGQRAAYDPPEIFLGFTTDKPWEFDRVRVLEPHSRIEIQRGRNQYAIAVLNNAEIRWLGQAKMERQDEYLAAVKRLKEIAVAALEKLGTYAPPPNVVRVEDRGL